MVDRRGRLVGVLSSSDIVQTTAERRSAGDTDEMFVDTVVRDIMTTPPKTIGPDEDVRAAARQMLALDVHRLFVVQQTELVGVIAQSDIVRAVADGKRSRELVLDAYLLRAMSVAGWAPALTECARCATPGPHRAFHVAAGGSVCGHCRPAGSTTPPMGVLDLMSALHDGDWEAAAGSTPAHRSHASGLVAAHLQWHLERRLRTLPLVERAQSGATGSDG